MATAGEWERATANRAEQIAHLARFAVIDHLTQVDIKTQHAVIHTLFVQTELVQNLILVSEGYPIPWDAIGSYRRFTNELAKLEGPPKQMYEMELLLAKRKELIRDIVYHLIQPTTRVSIELDRHKLISLAHVSNEIDILMRIAQQNTPRLRAALQPEQQEQQQDVLEQALDLHINSTSV
jgi:hypothetical protein